MTTQRLKSISRTNLLEGKRIIVTGCGYKPIQHKFYDLNGIETHDSVYVDGEEMKANIGAAASFVFAYNGADVLMVSRDRFKLDSIKANLVKDRALEEKVDCEEVDLLDEKAVDDFVRKGIPRDKPVYWFSSIGLGAGSYQLKDDNPYLHLIDIPIEFMEQEARTVLRGTHLLMKSLIPIFKSQAESRIAIISSMSAIRGYSRGGTHCASKGAISRYTNSAMFDLGEDNILVTDIRPGAIDTGMYDNPEVQKAVCEISDEYGGKYRERFALAPPISVGYAALLAFTLPATHITSINLVAQGQWPNEGS